MNTMSKKYLAKIIFPILLVIAAFAYNTFAGIACIIIYIAYILYSSLGGIYKIIANINYGKGDMDKALHYLKKSYETDITKTKTAVSYAYLLLKNGNTNESDRVLKPLLDSNIPQDEKMLVKSNYALILWKKGDVGEAVEMLEKVSEKYKTTAVYGSLGFLLILKGDLDRALEYNLEAHEYNSSNSIILDNLGETYYLRGEQDKAIETYEKLMSSTPAFPSAYYNYGLVLLKNGEHEKALENMQKALDFKFTYLSTVSKEEIMAKIQEIKQEVTG